MFPFVCGELISVMESQAFAFVVMANVPFTPAKTLFVNVTSLAPVESCTRLS